jgi:hypothetical protein
MATPDPRFGTGAIGRRAFLGRGLVASMANGWETLSWAGKFLAGGNIGI